MRPTAAQIESMMIRLEGPLTVYVALDMPQLAGRFRPRDVLVVRDHLSASTEPVKGQQLLQIELQPGQRAACLDDEILLPADTPLRIVRTARDGESWRYAAEVVDRPRPTLRRAAASVVELDRIGSPGTDQWIGQQRRPEADALLGQVVVAITPPPTTDEEYAAHPDWDNSDEERRSVTGVLSREDNYAALGHYTYWVSNQHVDPTTIEVVR